MTRYERRVRANPDARIFDTSHPDNVFDDAGGRWVAYCVRHGTLCNATSERIARDYATSLEFCEPHMEGQMTEPREHRGEFHAVGDLQKRLEKVKSRLPEDDYLQMYALKWWSELTREQQVMVSQAERDRRG